jgi:hypothetical protein
MEQAAVGWPQIAQMIGLSERTVKSLKASFLEAGIIFRQRLKHPPGFTWCMFPSDYRRWCVLYSQQGGLVPRPYLKRKPKSPNLTKTQRPF